MNERQLYNERELLTHLKVQDYAFQKIYDRYWEKLLGIALRKCNDLSMAEDCVQDVFMSLLHHKDPTKIENLEAYLAKAVKFAIIRAIYKHQRIQYLEEYPEGNYFDKLSVEDALEEKMLQEYIFDQVEQLPDRCRLIFKSSRQEHLSNEEIAEKMNISKRTVENQLSLAMKTLRKYLFRTILFFFS
ncbi:RNA polymerase sigma factor [Sphingobacterium psychroaquaticum]|uniref:RNA polymerase sigma factor n=1 Tax=Sphingobacterium psychroaquaticum TaxID=561061 RepID=UPI00141B1DA7|nr:RNA polymerase sigma-70 factor [Sphingobacterium psychroaquaticum]